jgi:hypothetical protein
MHERLEGEQPNFEMSFDAFVNGLEEIDELIPNVPYYILEAEEIARKQEARRNFFDNMNA